MRYNINLVSKKKFSFFERALYFFSNYLRYILVITQLVIIGVLFYRFRIDQGIIDLKETVEQKKEIVNVTSDLITEAKKIEAKTTAIKKVSGEQDSFIQMMEYTLSSFPKDIFLNRM